MAARHWLEYLGEHAVEVEERLTDLIAAQSAVYGKKGLSQRIIRQDVISPLYTVVFSLFFSSLFPRMQKRHTLIS